MSTKANVAVSDYFAKFIERQVTQGRFGSAEDVVHAGLRLLEEHEAKLEALRAALVEGEQSGFCTPFEFDEFMEERLRNSSSAS